jgi:hypothetical protein
MSAQHGFKDLHVQEKKNTLPDAQKGQTSHPPNPVCYFTRPP